MAIDAGQTNDMPKGEGTPPPRGDWPPMASAVGLPDGHQQRGSTGQLFSATNGRWERVEDAPKAKEEKRKTISVTCGAPTGISLRLYRKPISDGEPMMPDPEHNPVQLSPGNNPGIDAEFFAAWLGQNKLMAEQFGIAEDKPKSEKVPPAPKEKEI